MQYLIKDNLHVNTTASEKTLYHSSMCSKSFFLRHYHTLFFLTTLFQTWNQLFCVFSILQTNTKMDIVPCQLSNISLVSKKAFSFLYTSFKHLHLIMLHWILIATNRFTNTYSYAKGSKYFYPYHHTQEIYPDKYDFPKFLCWNIINSVL